MLPHKTRIAPTPSGYLHLGNVLSFALTATIAEKANARILLRIDDMDRGRVNTSYVQDIFDTLNFLEIPWHEGPRTLQEFDREWSQLHRLPLYLQALAQLMQEEQVFACTCSRAQIRNISADDTYPGTCSSKDVNLQAPHVSWRLHTNANRPLSVHAWPAGQINATLPGNLKHFVIRKKDGYPAYQLSSLIDDLHFGADLIVRGQDLWPSTLAQQYLAKALNADRFEQIQFYHHDLLTNTAGEKLSKSAGATSIRYLRQQGQKPAKIYQDIATMIGIDEPVNNWQQLGAYILDKQYIK